MGFRFRKSLKVAPGLRLNLGLKSISLSAGVKGASLSAGTRGLYGNVGIPGTGLSFREKIDLMQKSRKRSLVSEIPFDRIIIRINEQGKIYFLGDDGRQLPDNIVKKIRKRYADSIQMFINNYIKQINEDYEKCMELYKNTPRNGSIEHEDFKVIPPEKPILENISFFRNIFGLAEIEKKVNQEKMHLYKAQMEAWRRRKNAWPWVIEKAKTGDENSMSIVMEVVLSCMTWPKETLINYEFEDDPRKLSVDIDLPELENMPTELASRAGNTINVKIKKINDAQKLLDYAKLVHGIFFRMIGECFVALPYLNVLTMSGFTQRVDSGTGKIADEYVLSVKVTRSQWEEIELSRIDLIDPIETIGTFELVRDMKKNGELKAIQPLK